MKFIASILFSVIISKTAFGQFTEIDTTINQNKNKLRLFTSMVSDDIQVLKTEYQDQVQLVDTIAVSGMSNYELFDFDKDGYSDLILTYIGINSQNSIYLYDEQHSNFKKVFGIEKFSNAILLDSTNKYFYSYQKAGCADENWNSHLFRIVDFKAIDIAKIIGNNCTDEKILVYKLGNNNSLIEELDYPRHINELVDKWQFINIYWKTNYIRIQNY